MTKATIDVAIAILLHRSQVLVGWREAKQHQGNKHEFPGGKVECGETPVDACRREVYEEVGIDLDDWYTFDFIEHEYDDVIVRLHLFHAFVSVQQLSQIQQPWQWYGRDALKNLNFPKANDSIIARLSLPQQIKISNDADVFETLAQDQLLYCRQPHFEQAQISALQDQQLSRCMVNINLWTQLDPSKQNQVAAVHLKQHQLMDLTRTDLKCGIAYVAACHDQASLQHAQNIGCDAVMLSPVLATASHPDALPLGWAQFEAWVEHLHIPVFALGGMQSHLLTLAQQHGAYGIAGIRFI